MKLNKSCLPLSWVWQQFFFQERSLIPYLTTSPFDPSFSWNYGKSLGFYESNLQLDKLTLCLTWLVLMFDVTFFHERSLISYLTTPPSDPSLSWNYGKSLGFYESNLRLDKLTLCLRWLVLMFDVTINLNFKLGVSLGSLNVIQDFIHNIWRFHDLIWHVFGKIFISKFFLEQ